MGHAILWVADHENDIENKKFKMTDYVKITATNVDIYFYYYITATMVIGPILQQVYNYIEFLYYKDIYLTLPIVR